jgi:hypothetical protein
MEGGGHWIMKEWTLTAAIRDDASPNVAGQDRSGRREGQRARYSDAARRLGPGRDVRIAKRFPGRPDAVSFLRESCTFRKSMYRSRARGVAKKAGDQRQAKWIKSAMKKDILSPQLSS